jgi:hypothetical protein
MRKYLMFSAIALTMTGCSSEQTDKLLLEKDRIALVKSLTSDKIIVWKFVKMGLRASAVKDTTMPAYREHAKELSTVSQTIDKMKAGEKSISFVDAALLYRDYSRIKDFVIRTDEDIFPPLLDGLQAEKVPVHRSGADKLVLQNAEHAILSMVALAARDLGMEISLYECSKTQPDKLPDSEIKTLLQFVRGLLFFTNKFHYLSEDELSNNIKWLDNQPQVDLPYTRSFFNWGKFNNEQTHIAFHGLNHVFRGLDRLMMKRDIDEERALDDFEIFLIDAHQLGIQNETVLSIESYVYIKRGKNAQAIASLNKLKKSPLVSESERKSIQESIGYLNERKADDNFNGVYDKFFIGKIATRQMLVILAKIDWKTLLKKNNITHTDQIFDTIDQFEVINTEMQKMTDPKSLMDKGNDLKDKGKKLLEKVPDLF